MRARQLIEAEDPKRFLKRQAQAQPFEVRGRLRSWQVDGAGRVLSSKRLLPDPALYHAPTIVRFNVREYRLRHGHPPTGVVPIHDISYWGDNLYFPSQEECKYRTDVNPKHQYYRDNPDDLAPKDMAEAEDPKAVFGKLPRATPVYIKDMSFEDRPGVDPEMRWVAMWATPFMIDHRKEIRGCPAGVGREKWPAIRDLIDQTNKESGTKFFFQFSNGFTTYVKSTVEAEDPKRALRAASDRVKYHVVAQEATWGIDEEGNVLYYQPDPDAFPSDYQGIYPDVVKFDVAEHLKYWGDIPSGIDISDIGFWLKDGTYDGPDMQYRQDIKGGGIAR